MIWVALLTQDSIRVAFVDDHQMFLAGVRHLLDSSGHRFDITCFSSGVDLLGAFAQGSRFDVVVTDLTMRELNGLALISLLRERDVRVPTIVLSASEDALSRSHSELIGAFRFLHKSSDPEKLIEAILSAADKGDVDARESRIATRRAIFDSEGVDQIPVPKLGVRQLAVLELIAQGRSNQEIAAKLSISENTVKSHAKSIFRELGVNSRTAAAQRARDLALI